jgi:hypothetical protein
MKNKTPEEAPPTTRHKRKPTRKTNRPEIIWRNLEFSSFEMSVRLHASHPRGEEPFIESKPWLEVRGTAAEPVKGVKDVVVSMYPEDTLVVGPVRPASCGAIIGVRPALHFVLSWSHLDFDRVWSMALAGRLTHGHFAFTKPHYGGGHVVSASFTDHFEE